jgi:cystathionine beta-lyase/cystathionine gamma-synthase
MLDAHACAQLERGLKTLALRVQRHNENAATLARFLASHPAVSRVNYPGLPEHPDHAIAARQMRGFGGMLSFELRQAGTGWMRLLSRLRIVMPALSLGGVEEPDLRSQPQYAPHDDGRRATACRHQRRLVARLCRHRGCCKTCSPTSPTHWPWNDLSFLASTRESR